jgi:hypothetical protein
MFDSGDFFRFYKSSNLHKRIKKRSHPALGRSGGGSGGSGGGTALPHRRCMRRLTTTTLPGCVREEAEDLLQCHNTKAVQNLTTPWYTDP